MEKVNCLAIQQWSDIETSASKEILEKKILPSYLKERRWFSGKSRDINSVTIQHQVCIPTKGLIPGYLWLLNIGYHDGGSENYLCGVCFIPEREMPEEQMRPPLFCQVTLGLENGWLCDATWCNGFREDLLRHFVLQSDIAHGDCHLRFKTHPSFNQVARDIHGSRILNAEQSNTSIIFGNALFLKLYRKVELGLNPDIELSKFITTETHFTDTPAWVGEIQWETNDGIIGVGILQEMIPQSTVGWNHFLPLIGAAIESPAADHGELWRKVEQLGTLTAGMHNALLPPKDIPEFTPQWMDVMELEGLRGRVMSEVDESFNLLRRNLNKLSPKAKMMATQLLQSQDELNHILKETYQMGNNAMLIRLHGDLHLGQVLVSDDRMLITDFEGEPGRSYEERRMKQPPVKDIAGMIRSFQYAIYSAKMSKSNNEFDDDLVPLENLLHQMTDIYLRAYTTAFEKSAFPVGDFNGFLRFFVIEKAVYELKYEINNRPDWAIIPIAGLQSAIRDWMESGLQHR